MEFGVAMEIESSVNKRANELQRFIDKLSHHIESFNYGTGIEHFTIGLVCIKSKPGYENWYQQRKPSFKRIEKVNMLDGTVMELHNSFTYDIKLTDKEIDIFISSTNSAIELFCSKLIDSLSGLQSPSMSKRDFNFLSLKMDIENFIKCEQYA